MQVPRGFPLPANQMEKTRHRRRTRLGDIVEHTSSLCEAIERGTAMDHHWHTDD